MAMFKQNMTALGLITLKPSDWSLGYTLSPDWLKLSPIPHKQTTK